MGIYRAVVQIIESPCDRDILDGRLEGQTLGGALRLGGIENDYYLATSGGAFAEAVGRARSQFASDAAAVPFLHLSAHGNSDGIKLTDGTWIAWDDLAASIRQLTEGDHPRILLAMSSCEGFSAAQMAWGFESPPFAGLWGPRTPVSWSESLVAFHVLYHRLVVKGGLAVEGLAEGTLDAMCRAAALPSGTFEFAWGESQRDEFCLGLIRERFCASGQ